MTCRECVCAMAENCTLSKKCRECVCAMAAPGTAKTGKAKKGQCDSYYEVLYYFILKCSSLPLFYRCKLNIYTNCFLFR